MTERHTYKLTADGKRIDENGNINCVNCISCVGCIDCVDCNGCISCVTCLGCYRCLGCSLCYKCSENISCSGNINTNVATKCYNNIDANRISCCTGIVNNDDKSGSASVDDKELESKE